MKKVTLAAAGSALGLLLLLGSRPGKGVVFQKGPAGRRVLLIGDSFAVGLKMPLAAIFVAAGIPFEGHGEVGTTIRHWASSSVLGDALASFRPTDVLVSLGTNDEKEGGTVAQAEAPSLAALLSKIQNAGASVLWIGAPTLSFPRAGVSDMVKRTVARYFPSEILSIPRGGDGLHPTPAGYTAWANAIWDWMASGHTYEAA